MWVKVTPLDGCSTPCLVNLNHVLAIVSAPHDGSVLIFEDEHASVFEDPYEVRESLEDIWEQIQHG